MGPQTAAGGGTAQRAHVIAADEELKESHASNTSRVMEGLGMWGFEVQGLEFRVEARSLNFRVCSLGFGVWGLGFGVWAHTAVISRRQGTTLAVGVRRRLRGFRSFLW
jgi:hypothetical protein